MSPNYYCQFGEYLLNSDYIMLPFGELSRRRDFLFQTLGVEGRVFVRPDSPLKLFTGQIATETTFDADLELMGFYEFPEHELVVVSSPKSIVREWRFLVVDGCVVTGSEYDVSQRFSGKPADNAGAEKFASTIASHGVAPDLVWLIDVCELESGEYRLMEIGGFSFASLYACDKRQVVQEVSRAAETAYRASLQ